eukprot:848088-Prorocentrum_minimum.AAC.1
MCDTSVVMCDTSVTQVRHKCDTSVTGVPPHLVELLALLEVRERDGGEHRPVAVQQAAVVHVVALALLGKVANSARKLLEVTGRLAKLLHPPRLLHRRRAQVRQAPEGEGKQNSPS